MREEKGHLDLLRAVLLMSAVVLFLAAFLGWGPASWTEHYFPPIFLACVIGYFLLAWRN